ncbi:hypothetical protein N7532_005074 [Penicillium argentinense]|uniref:PHD-type domain-containing protein n=1 Tax=Penicillium argentinense TaxID=1131581 RepID=A0A9W9FD71_9EURO|nr:uncharacterized protein N7532_005074 [Penicillium argentinense]KAJ5098073.1 hypothetical protein N7532_005074 [Penicillium argentinense]
MKPIGEYPSLAEYKLAGLKPPRKIPKIARSDEDEGAPGTPLTPVAEEEATAVKMLRTDEYEQMSGLKKTDILNHVKSSTEDVVVANGFGVKDNEELVVNETNSATPTLEALDPHPAFTSMSLSIHPPDQLPASGIHSSVHSTAHSTITSLDTPVDEINSPLLTLSAPPTNLTIPDIHLSSNKNLRQPLSPGAPVSGTDGTMSSTPGSSDYLTILRSLPCPVSTRFDVAELKQVMEVAVTHTANAKADNAALALVYYWAGISGDEFKFLLLHNMGLEKKDHILELALQTILRHSIDEATLWYQTYVSENRRLFAGPRSPASSLGNFSRADIYRDTSGKKAQDDFLAGKTNTAPLKRATKPCRADENPYRRRREWEADPTHEERVNEKRVQLAKAAKSDLTVAETSHVRPQRGPPDAIQHPYSHTSEKEDDNMSSTSSSTAVNSRRTRNLKNRLKAKGNFKGKGKAKGKEKLLRLHTARSVSPDSGVGDSDETNSYYSDHSGGWDAEFEARQMPNEIIIMDNDDFCYVCGEEGELLCCDKCDNSFHFDCLDPPIDENDPPEGDWFCGPCWAKNHFTETIARAIRSKKKKITFSPPQSIKEYFEGVSEEILTDTHYPPETKRTHGFYKSVPTLPRLTKAPRDNNSNKTPLYDDPNLTKMMENGHVILCNRCGTSTDDTRPIIRCDYCECRFHLDCLDPPMAKPPNPYNGWQCPNHVTIDDLVVTKVVDGRLQQRRPRRPKDTVTVRSPRWDADRTWHESFEGEGAEAESPDLAMNFINHVKKQVPRIDPQTQEGLEGLLQLYNSETASPDAYDAASSLLDISLGEPIMTSEQSGRKKRSRAESEASSSTVKPAQKRQHTDAD